MIFRSVVSKPRIDTTERNPQRRVLVRECPRTVPAPGPKTATRRRTR